MVSRFRDDFLYHPGLPSHQQGPEVSKKKPKTPKARNWLAVHARNRRGGPMVDRKKKANKLFCRTKSHE
jgi:lauroyl/myristoyl acyltransferase